jgi:putative redox protein
VSAPPNESTVAGAAAPAAKPGSARVAVSWAGARRFDAGRPGGPTLRLDGSGETGQSPVDALLSALAACTAIDLVDILAKRRTPAERLTVNVEGTRADGTPRRLTAVRLDYTLDGAGITRSLAESFADLAVAKYCSVRDSLDPAIAVTYTIALNGEAGAERRPEKDSPSR